MSRPSDPFAPRPLSFSGADGVTLRADARGDPAAPIVLFLHGGGQTRHAWGGTARAVAAAGFRAISMEHRGHGDSGWSAEGDYSSEAFVGDLVGVSARLPAKPIIVGASLRGIT